MNDAEISLDSNDSRSRREPADEVEPQPAPSSRFEEALRESDERYRRLFEDHHAIMLLYDPETFNIVDANPAACHYYGYSHAQLTAMKITDLNGMTLEQAAGEYQRVRQPSEQPYLLKHRLATGEIRDVESYAGPIQLGGRAYQFSIVHDITRRKQAEDELHHERNFVSAILDVVGALIVVLDREGRIVRFNRACEALTGYAFAEVKDRHLWDLFLTPEELEPVRRVFERLGAGDFPLQFENYWLTKDGRRRLIAWSNTALAAEDGTIEYVIGTGVDVSERRQAEQEIRQFNAELQARNTELNAFAYTVAHDIKNPLHLMIGYADVLADIYAQLPAEVVVTSLQTILKSGRKLNSITDSLLLLSQVRQKDIVREPLDMEVIIAEARLRVSNLIDDQTEIRMPAWWPRALGYEPWVEEVWANYLSNALKHGAQPARIELGGEPLPNGMARFWIRDNGNGIALTEQALLFDAFYQPADSSSGYGLGLSIVKGIVEKLGGEVAMQSSGVPGEGSTFSFTLPAA